MVDERFSSMARISIEKQILADLEQKKIAQDIPGVCHKTVSLRIYV